jgi:hypothetical protein
VRVAVIDCTAIGFSPPMRMEPMVISRVVRFKQLPRAGLTAAPAKDSESSGRQVVTWNAETVMELILSQRPGMGGLPSFAQFACTVDLETWRPDEGMLE